MTEQVALSPKVQQLVDLFFAQAADQPEAYVSFFKEHIRGLSLDELWLLMDTLTERVGQNVYDLYARKMGQPA